MYSFATGRNLVGTSPTCWRHEIFKYLILWLDLALLVTTPLKLLKKRKDLLLCIEVKKYKYDRIVRGKKSLLARK